MVNRVQKKENIQEYPVATRFRKQKTIATPPTIPINPPSTPSIIPAVCDDLEEDKR